MDLLSIVIMATLYASTSAILSIGTREFGLFNLASGAWIILGSWLGGYLYSLYLGTQIRCDYFLFLYALGFLLLQVFLTYKLGDRFRENKLTYLFISLGIALIILNIIPEFVLGASDAWINISPSLLYKILVSVLLIVIVCFPYLIFKSASWSKTVLFFRSNQMTNKLKRKLATIVLVEILMLMTIGALSFFTTKGQFYSSEFLTVIPILSILAFKFHPLKGAILSFTLIAISQMVILLSPSFGGIEWANYSTPLTIFALVGIIMIKNLPKRFIVNARLGHFFPMRIYKLYSFRQNKNAFIGYLSFALVFILAVLINSNFSRYLSDSDLSRTVLIMTLVILTFLIQRVLNVMTLSLTVIGTICAYLVYHLHDSPLYLVIWLLLLSIFSCLYLLVLRGVKEELALLIDLAILVSLHHLIKASPIISGIDEVITNFPVFNLFEIKFLVILVVAFLALLFSNLIGSVRFLRRNILAIANFRAGVQFGYRSVNIFLAFALGIIICVFLVAVDYHTVLGSVSVSITKLEFGLVIFLFSYLAHKRGLWWAFIIIFLYYSLFSVPLAGIGTFKAAIIGVLFILMAFIFKNNSDGYERA